VGHFHRTPCGAAVSVRRPDWRLKTLSLSLRLVSTRRLSWGFQRSPLHRHTPTTSTPTHLPRFPVWGHFGLPLPRAGPVPSSRFHTALTVYSVVDPAGLLHPAADHGVRRVAAPRRFPCGIRFGGLPRRLTLRSFSLSSSSPLSRDFCPLADYPSKDGSTSGPFSAGESVASQPCCHA
jgi:hypothetical protein